MGAETEVDATDEVPFAPEGRPGLASLIGRSGVPGVGELVIRETRVRLGRDRECEVVIPGPSIAKVHAELRLRGGIWWVGDLGTEEGTWVDGERVTTSAPLAPGSILRLGQAVLIFSPADAWTDSPDALLATPLSGSGMSVAWEPRDEPMAPEFNWPLHQTRPRWPLYVGIAVLAGLLLVTFLLRDG